MLYFIIGFVGGVVSCLIYNFVVKEYLHLKREVHLLNNQKEYYLREVGNLKDYMDWKRANR